MIAIDHEILSQRDHGTAIHFIKIMHTYMLDIQFYNKCICYRKYVCKVPNV